MQEEVDCSEFLYRGIRREHYDPFSRSVRYGAFELKSREKDLSFDRSCGRTIQKCVEYMRDCFKKRKDEISAVSEISAALCLNMSMYLYPSSRLAKNPFHVGVYLNNQKQRLDDNMISYIYLNSKVVWNFKTGFM